jgi:hypothetical protein
MLFSCVMIYIWLSLKEIHQDDIKYCKREIPRLMCEMKMYLPPTFFNAQEHCLIHQEITMLLLFILYFIDWVLGN